jgi:hypothetical protein
VAIVMRAPGVEHDDVPIGAVVVHDGEVIGAGRNEREFRADPSSARSSPEPTGSGTASATPTTIPGVVPQVTWGESAPASTASSESKGAPSSVPSAPQRSTASSIWDSPNSAGIVIDAVRCCKLALNHGVAGQLDGPSSYLMKSPMSQRPDPEARELTEAFIAEHARGPGTGPTEREGTGEQVAAAKAAAAKR